MPQQIPLTADGEQFFTITLEDTPVRLRVRRNTRQGVWYLDIYDEDAEPVVQGVAMVLGADILAQYSLGLGGLVMYNDTESVDASATNLGERVILLHYSEAELAV